MRFSNEWTPDDLVRRLPIDGSNGHVLREIDEYFQFVGSMHLIVDGGR
jgi:hypothetical protein